jgi:hypothetical protein
MANGNQFLMIWIASTLHFHSASGNFAPMHTPLHFPQRFVSVLIIAAFLPLTGFAADSPSALETTPQGWVDLMPPANLAGWTQLPFPKTNVLIRAQWHLDTDRHVLISDGDGGHDMLRFDREVTNGIFHVEFRFVPVTGEKVKYNSGIFVRNSADGTVWHQCQLTMNGGFLFGTTPTNNTLKRFKSSVTEPRMKPAGDWNSAEVTARGHDLNVWLNGATVTDFSDCGQPAGYLALETEGYAIEFRNLKLKELP